MSASQLSVCLVSIMALLPISASAMVIGQSDTFEDSMNGWYAGENVTPPVPPQVVADGGPSGAGDAYLKITAQGGFGPGSRLAAINNSQWSGNYLAAGISQISMDLNNLGTSDLTIRLLFGGTGGQAVTEGIVLPSGSGWVNVEFLIDPSTLTSIGGDAAAVLGSTAALRIIHNPGVGNAAPIAGVLGVDNIVAQSAVVPLPAGIWLMWSGLLALLALRKLS